MRWEGASQEKRKRLEQHPLAAAKALPMAEPSLVGWIKEGEGGAVEQQERGLKSCDKYFDGSRHISVYATSTLYCT